jgi:hypothetical protein
MNIDEFNKYKRLLESSSPEMLSGNEDAMRVYAWMEESGRIDEGFFGSIWSWLKRNFSPRARRIYRLADDFGRELKKEMEAEFGRKADSKDMAAQMRSSWAGRISGDIKEKMEIEAGDDDDYRELVRLLINKKTLEGKREMLKYLDKGLAKTVRVELDNEQQKNDKALKEQYDKFTVNEKKELEDIRKHLTSEVEKYRNTLSIAFKDSSSLNVFIEAFSSWMLASSKVQKSKVKFDISTVDLILRDIIKFTESESKRIAGGYGVNTAITAILKGFIKSFTEPNPMELSKIKTTVSEYAKEQLEKTTSKKDDSTEDQDDANDEDENVKDDLTTPVTSKIISDDEVDTAIDKAKKSTGESKPTNEDIIEAVNGYLESKVLTANLQYYTDVLNKKIEKFNKLNDADKTAAIKDYSYKLEKGNILPLATTSDVKSLLKNFMQIVGEIVPYYFKRGDEEDRKYLTTSIMLFIFEIYAVKKDVSGSISDAEATKIAQNVIKQNPDQFR